MNYKLWYITYKYTPFSQKNSQQQQQQKFNIFQYGTNDFGGAKNGILINCSVCIDMVTMVTETNILL